MEKCENQISNSEEKNTGTASETSAGVVHAPLDLTTELDAMSQGKIPESLEHLTALGKRIMLVANLAPAAMSIILAKSRADYLTPADWVKWAESEFEFSGAYLHHLHAVGKMLLSLNDGDNAKHYRRLFSLSFNKLHVLVQLPVADVPNFITINRVEALSRDEIRALVKKWLGQETAEGQEKEEILPGFEDLFSFVAKFKDAKEIREAFVSRAKDMETAEKFFNTGVCLLGGSLEYMKEHGDIEFLEAFKAELEADTADIEAAIEKRKKG